MCKGAYRVLPLENYCVVEKEAFRIVTGLTRDIPCSPTPVSPTPISPTLDRKVAFRLLIKNSSICNVLNINDLLNIQHNNNTTLPQYLYISVCRHSLYITCSSFCLYSEQLSCCLLVLDHFHCANTPPLVGTLNYYSSWYRQSQL